MLTNLFATMSDRCIVQKSFNEKFAEYCNTIVPDEADMQFLYCNAHFLLGLSTQCEKDLKAIEITITTELGHALGQNTDAKFAHFNCSSESSAARYIRTGCDSFDTRGDEKNGCRHQWLAYCSEVVKKKNQK